VALELQHQTRYEFLVRLRDRTLSTQGLALVPLARFILTSLEQDIVTDDELRLVFNYTPATWAAFENKLDDILDAYNVVVGTQ